MYMDRARANKATNDIAMMKTPVRIVAISLRLLRLPDDEDDGEERG